MLLSCGEALIDMLPAKCGETQEDGFVPKPGGAVFNTAVALGRLGADSAFFSGLSSDLFGKMLNDSLLASGVDTSLCDRSERPTTMAYVKLTDGQAQYVFHDENSAMRLIGVDDLPVVPDAVRGLFFGGISLVGDPCGGALVALAERESATKVIMADPNIRPDFIRDEAGYRHRLNRLLSVADVVKVSDEDLDWIVPGPLTLQEKGERLLDLGVQVLLITKGKDGVSCFTSCDRRLDVAITPSKVVDTVGAGDTFNAGFLFSLWSQDLMFKEKVADLSDQNLLDAIGFGARVAAIVVGRVGANPPWAAELEDMPQPG